MKYIHLFDTVEEFNEVYNGQDYEEPWVSYTKDSEGFGFNKKTPPTPPGPESQYLTFNITSPGYINWVCSCESAATIEYSKNGGEWTEITAIQPIDEQTMQGATINVVAGDTVMFRGDNDTYASFDTEEWIINSVFGSFSFSTCGFELEGNLMSLIDSRNFSSLSTLTSSNNGAFAEMFYECTGITSVENDKLIFPTGLTYGCFMDMFYGNSFLKNYLKFTGVTQTQEQLNELGCFDCFIECAENGSAILSNSLIEYGLVPCQWYINKILFDRCECGLGWMSYGTYSDNLKITTTDVSWTAITESSAITLSQTTGGIGETDITISCTISQDFHPSEATISIQFNCSDGSIRPFNFVITAIK